MKRILFLMTLAFGLCTVSCGKMEGQQSTAADNQVVVNFSLGNGTKATTGVFEDAIHTAYLFAFDGNRLDGSAYATSSTGTIKVTPGSRRFIAVVNPNEEFSFGSLNTPSAIMALVSQLSSEAINDMVMIGDNTVTIDENSTYVTVNVVRLVSKIYVKSLKFQFTGALEGKSVSDVAMYIKNFPTTETYAGVIGTTYSSGLFSDKQNTFEVYDYVGTMNDGQRETLHQFFCYPRPTASLTTGSGAIRLCITGKIDGQRYYWSLPVNNGSNWTEDAFVSGDEHYGVMRNHSYEYEITITRAGIPDDGSDPDPNDPDDIGDDDLEDDEDLQTSDLHFILNVVNFIEVEEQTITF
ncbi:MAG: FimB/Mfa2 family fimbrial subunit [Bacteroidales bacterium]|nr:FimB/Mfa2 family fimbrial subunit [Bacteroidales bacterium]